MKNSICAVAALLVTFGSLSAQSAGRPSWSLMVSPSVSVPLFAADGTSDLSFSSAWGGTLGAEYSFGAASPLALRLGAGYSVGGLLASGGVQAAGTLNEASLTAGVGLRKSLSPALALRGFLDAGVAYGSLSSGVSAPYAAVRTGGGIDLQLNKDLTARIDTAFLFKSGLYGGVGAAVGLGYRLPEGASSGIPARLRLLDLLKLDIKNVFPIFRSYYDQNPVGTATISNTGKETATNVRVSFIIKQYMDAAKECATIAKLEPGNSIEVPLYGLFNDRILDVTEATKVSAEVFVEYAVVERGGDGGESKAATVTVYDRNALTWSDDRKAAAFVSSKDPWVLDLTGNILAAVKNGRNPELAANIQTAIAFHEGLRAYGISYVLSPNRPFAKDVVDPEIVDTLKFPRQVLTFRAGDCADLSVLYASLFEAAGIETAFVTVPGHIFMAIDLGMTLAEAKAHAIDERELILHNGKVWLPIETTMRDSGFLEIWRKAASEWRDASERKLAAVYPLHEAWKTYAPVGLPADGSRVIPPASDKIVKVFNTELVKAVDSELNSRLSSLGPVSTKGAQAAKGLNDRGVLYGRFGRYTDAVRDFQAAAKAGSDSALVNLGNVSMLKADPGAALEYYQAAARRFPGNSRLLVNLAKSAAALGKIDLAAGALAEVRKIDPKAADQYSALAQAGTSKTRAAAIDDGSLAWF